MKIKIICIGKLKEKYWTDAVQEYVKRLGAYSDVEIVELKEYKQQGEGPSAEAKVIEEEGLRILDALSRGKKPGGSAGTPSKSSFVDSRNQFVITLEIQGKKLSSEQLAEKINALTVECKSEIIFIIGGSLGLSPEVSEISDLKLSFSDMTFPHQMMRVILLEQIYRSFKIIKGEAYHK